MELYHKSSSSFREWPARPNVRTNVAPNDRRIARLSRVSMQCEALARERRPSNNM